MVDTLNFANIAPLQQESPIDSLLRGYKAVYTPDLLNAQISRLNSTGTNLSGPAGNAFKIEMLKRRLGEDDPRYLAAKNAFDAESNRQRSISDFRARQAQSLAHRALPSKEKERVLAMAVGMGYDPSEASALLTQGFNLTELASQKGMNLRDVKPNFPMSSELRKKAQGRQAQFKELQVLEDEVTGALGPYARKVFGFSPSQVVDAIRGKNPDEQGKFLAARALSPEIAALRLNIAGGQAGITAIEEMQKKSLNNSRIFDSLVGPQAYRAMNRYLTEWLGRGQNAYNDYLEAQGQLGNANDVSGRDIVNTLNEMNMSEEELAAYLKELSKGR